jgi:4-hydroxythreonine-4-phosphate dehydrogenase
VADAQNRRDLTRIAKWLIERHGQTMAVGSAGLAEALAATAMGEKAGFQRPGRSEHPFLYVVGSRSPRSDRQVERLLRENSECVEIAAPQGRFDPIAAARTLSRRSCGVIRIPRLPDDPPADEVASALGESVAALLDIFKFRALLLTGGDVTAAVLQAINESILTLEGQISPGVPLSHVEHSGERLWLVTKAGGFGDEDLLLNIPPLLGS